MSERTDQIHLGAFLLATGNHVAAWRHPTAQADGGANIEHYIDLALAAEKACFDLIFIADTQGGFFDRKERDLTALAAQVALFEPLTLLSAIASRTQHIGLVGTATTTYYEPYILARLFASLDVLSQGRAGWNLVTSASPLEAQNFGKASHPGPEERYERAEEFVDVVKGLWESWEDDAFLRDKASGRFSDTSKLHMLDHIGRHFSVSGPLNVPRSPQGHPVVVQAGSSDPGRALAARTAEVVFTAHETADSARTFYADLKGRMPMFGRDPASLKILPGILPIVGGTEEEARAKYNALNELVHPDLPRYFIARSFHRLELLDHPVDEPLPDWLEVDGRVSRPALLLDFARREKLTARELFLRVAGARGHCTIMGTPEMIADKLEYWFDSHAADGFNIMPAHLPEGLTDFTEQVVPELQRRGRFRKEYEGTTLREALGLDFPRHSALRKQVA